MTDLQNRNIIKTRKLGPFQKFYLGFFLTCLIGPFLPLIIASFSFRWGWPDILPQSWWWEMRGQSSIPLAWDYIFAPYSRIVDATLNTVLIALAVTLISLVICLPAARVLARNDFRGKSLIEFYLMTPLVIPEIAVGLGMLMIFLQFGLTGTYIGLVLAHLVPTIPYMLRMLVAIYQELDKGVEEQAMLLGAGPLRTFFSVSFPMIMPGVLAGSLYAFLISTNIFLLTFFISQGRIDTLATLLFAKISAGGVVDPVTAGMALIVSLPGLIFLLFTERFLKEELFISGIGRR